MNLLKNKKHSTKRKLNETPEGTSDVEEQSPESTLNIISPGKTVNDYLGFDFMHEDGICRIEEGLYSMMTEFEDISYQDKRYEEQFDVFKEYTQFLNSNDSDVDMMLLLTNKVLQDETVKQTMFLEMGDEGEDKRFNLYRKEINNMVSKNVLENYQSVDRRNYILFSAVEPTKDLAHTALQRVCESAIRKFEDIDSDMRVMTGAERLAVMAGITRPDDELLAQDIDYETLRGIPGKTTKDLIAPYCFDEVDNSTFKFGDYYGQILCVTDYASTVKDELLAQFRNLPIDLVIAMHVKTMEQADAIDLIDQQLGDMNTERIHEIRKHSQNFFYTEEMLPTKLKDGLSNAKKLYRDVMNNDQKMFSQTLLFFTYAKDQETLQKNIDEILRVGRRYSYKIDPCSDMQRSRGWPSVLPVGRNRVPIERQLTTAPLAAFIPFNTEELMQRGGAFYGLNWTSKNPIFFRRSSLDAPNGMIVGRPGKGKSFAAKIEITNTLLTEPKASVDVIDPEREFTELANGFDGEIIRIAANSKWHINPFDISEDYSDEDDPLTVKIDFILSLLKEMTKGNLSAIQESIVDRVCTIIYEPFFNSAGDRTKLPIFTDFNRELREQPEEEAQTLATTIERYVTGSMSTFNHHTNVDTEKRFRIWDIKDLGKSMRTVGLLVVLDQVWNRIVLSREQGNRSHFYTDEWQLLLKNDYAIDFYDELWSRARKWGAVPTAITQNITRVVKNEKARLMLANSDFLLLLSQSKQDAEVLRDLLQLSDANMRHIRSKKKGAGLLIAGSKLIPYMNEYDRTTELYRMFTTKFDDIVDMIKHTEAA